MERVCSDFERREADAADGDAGACFELPGELSGFDLDAAAFCFCRDAGYVADFFDDSCEHVFRINHGGEKADSSR